MSWAARRRFLILLILGGVAAAFLTVVSISAFYKTPSCTDNTQNQDEEGVDCGGSCSYLCTAKEQPPTVLFTKALTNSEGRTDIVASVENRNPGVAAKNVPYRVKLFDSNQTLIQEVTGTFDLPPSATQPIYVPGVVSGKRMVTGAFLDIASSSLQWFSMPVDSRIVLSVFNRPLSGATSSPRIEAVLTNPSVTTLTNVRAIVLVRNSKGDVIAASSTIVPAIPGQGQAIATFTWNSAFPGTPSVIEVIPIIPLP